VSKFIIFLQDVAFQKLVNWVGFHEVYSKNKSGAACVLYDTVYFTVRFV